MGTGSGCGEGAGESAREGMWREGGPVGTGKVLGRDGQEALPARDLESGPSGAEGLSSHLDCTLLTLGYALG